MPLDHATEQIFVFKVRQRYGAYVTSTIRGQRASSTTSAERAATVLAGKLLPNAAATVERVSLRTVDGVETWRARA